MKKYKVNFSVHARGLILLLIGLLTFPSVYSQPYAGKLGVEMSQDVFVDIIKQAYRFEKTTGGSISDAEVDASGWPKTDVKWIWDNRPVAEWTGSENIDDPDRYRVDRSGTYKGSFIGQATFESVEGSFTISNQVYNEATNTTTFDLTLPAPGPGGPLVILNFTNTKLTPSSPTGSGFANFKLIRPGYPANTTQTFTNEFFKTLTNADFSTIRFMSILGTNNHVIFQGERTGLLEWDQRKLTTDAYQIGGIKGKQQGLAWEYVIEICNRANMDLWLNIPAPASDDYIRELAKLVKNTLNPNLNIYLEHSNEVWNFGFIQYAWIKLKAKEELDAGGSNYAYDGTKDFDDYYGQRRHAKRTRDIVNIFASEFGQQAINDKIRGVLAGVTTDPEGFFIQGRLAGMLQYLKDNYGDPKNYIYGISIPNYYGGPAGEGSEVTRNYSLQQVLDSMSANIDASKAERIQGVNLARSYQLPGGLMAYEGGPSIGGGSTTNIVNRIRAVRDPQQKDTFKKNLAEAWWDLGAGLSMQFALESSYQRFGAWGLTDDINNPDRNSLFQAARELIGDGPRITGYENENPDGNEFNGVYKITAKHSGKALDVSGISTAREALVHQWEYVGGDNQKWNVTATADGYYEIKAVHSNKALDVPYASTADGVQLWQYDPNGSDAQKWSIESVGDGYYKIISKASGKALDVSAVSSANGAKIHQWTYFGNDNQKWALELLAVARVGQQAEQAPRTLSIYPMPADQEINLAYSAERAGTVVVEVTDLLGRRLIKETLQSSAGLNKQTLSAGRLKAGQYIITVTRDGKRSSQHLFINR